jgi:hypothetical protein
VIAEVRRDIKLLTELGESARMDERCLTWLRDYLSLFETGQVVSNLTSTDLEERRIGMYLWMRGSVLFRGDLAYRLPLVGRVMFEVGKQHESVDFADEFWVEKGPVLCDELCLSDVFRKLALVTSQPRTIRNAFLRELAGQPDQAILRRFVRRRQLADGVFAGCLSGTILADIPMPKTLMSKGRLNRTPGQIVSAEERAHFKGGVETVAEYLLSAFGAVAEADELLRMVPEALSTKYDILTSNLFKRLLGLQQPWYSLASLSPNVAASSAFRLGAILAKAEILEGDRIPLDIDLAYEVEDILRGLSVREDLVSQVRQVVARAVSGKVAGRAELSPSAVAIQLSKSFENGESDITDSSLDE